MQIGLDSDYKWSKTSKMIEKAAQDILKSGITSFTLFALCPLAPAWAEDVPQEQPADIIVYGRAIEQIGIASTASEGTVGYQDFEQRPLSRVGELAENVPGLIATQHSGTGKANQFFLRGFNLDHGTDLAGLVDVAPINMRSHGHGQGYLDLNFLIPEMVERIDYRKGPYSVESGDFSAAGSLAFQTKRELPGPFAQLTGGSFGYARALLASSGKAGNGALLAALDGTVSNGPWVLNERLRKLNGLLKYSGGTAQDGWSLGLSGYGAKWQATDQVPERAISSGLIPRPGFIDGDLGGKTTRLALNFQRNSAHLTASAYAIHYRFRLTSNFTYLLDDPVGGDEFQQRDQRAIFGGSIRYRSQPEEKLSLRVGADARYDRIGKVGLYHSAGGVRTSTVREDRVDEYSGALLAEAEWKPAETLRVIAGLRGDAIGYRVRSDLAANSGIGSDGFVAPKVALAWKPAPALELYANYGESFHSNDVRGATINLNPVSGDPADRVPVFSRARGAELGARVEAGALTASLVGYWLKLGSELVFVGDAGTTEPSDASRRYGVEASLFWKPANWLTLDGTAAFTNARFRGVTPGLERIPGAVSNVISGGVHADLGSGFGTSARLRHFGSAPLIEDGSVRSEPTTLVNLGGYWTRGRVHIAIDLLNAFNAKDPDISYFYASRLPGEAAEGVEDRHIHPVEPRQVRATVKLVF
ncbi:MAG: TonB-dependent receptor [Sphingorhabdus sp.]